MAQETVSLSPKVFLKWRSLGTLDILSSERVSGSDPVRGPSARPAARR